ADRVVHDKKDYGPDDGHQQAPDVEPGDARHSKSPEEPTAKEGADYAEEYVQQAPFALPVDYFAGDKTCYQTQHDPAYQVYVGFLHCISPVSGLDEDFATSTLMLARLPETAKVVFALFAIPFVGVPLLD